MALHSLALSSTSPAHQLSGFFLPSTSREFDFTAAVAHHRYRGCTTLDCERSTSCRVPVIRGGRSNEFTAQRFWNVGSGTPSESSKVMSGSQDFHAATRESLRLGEPWSATFNSSKAADQEVIYDSRHLSRRSALLLSGLLMSSVSLASPLDSIAATGLDSDEQLQATSLSDNEGATPSLIDVDESQHELLDVDDPFRHGQRLEQLNTQHLAELRLADASACSPESLALTADSLTGGTVPVGEGSSVSIVIYASLPASMATTAGIVPTSAAVAVAAPSIVGSGGVVAAATVMSSAAVGAHGIVSACAGSVQAVIAAPATVAAGLSSRATDVLLQALQHLGGGGVAGAVGASVVYPLDTVKTRMQAQGGRGSTDGQCESSGFVYKNELDCLQQLVRDEGISSLYSGLGPQLVGIAPEKALKLTVNEFLLQLLELQLPGARIWMLEFIAGGGGGLSQVLFTNPVEIVKVRMQTQSMHQHHHHPLHQDHGQALEGGAAALDQAPKTTLQVVRELGLKGLYSGSSVTVARDVPSSALFFGCYALLQQLDPESSSFVNGCVAAIPAAFFVTPMDVIKTKMQMEPVEGGPVYKDPWDCLQQVLREEGWSALFSGGVARVLRMCPQFGITLVVYDWLCSL